MKLLLAILSLIFPLEARAEISIDLRLSSFDLITFDKVTPTKYSNDGSALKVEVDGSSSFLLRAFDKRVVVKSISFEWRSLGDLKVSSADAQKTKAGDDARLRVGIVVAGDPPMIPMFAPAWIKLVREKLKLPAGKLVFALAGTPVSAGTSWVSPYNDDIRLFAVKDQFLDNDWHRARIDLPEPLEAIGVWIMADGDNTGSKFTTWVRSVALQ